MARLWLLNLRLNICIDNDSSRDSSNSSTCNILSSSTVLIWVGIVTGETFSLTEMIRLRLNSFWITVDRIKSTSKEKQIKLSSKFNSLLSHEMSSLFQCSFYPFKQASYLCVPSSLFCFSRKVVSKNLPLVSCFVKSNFCWQSTEIRLPYLLSSIYAKWLALN